MGLSDTSNAIAWAAAAELGVSIFSATALPPAPTKHTRSPTAPPPLSLQSGQVTTTGRRAVGLSLKF